MVTHSVSLQKSKNQRGKYKKEEAEVEKDEGGGKGEAGEAKIRPLRPQTGGE